MFNDNPNLAWLTGCGETGYMKKYDLNINSVGSGFFFPLSGDVEHYVLTAAPTVCDFIPKRTCKAFNTKTF